MSELWRLVLQWAHDLRFYLDINYLCPDCYKANEDLVHGDYNDVDGHTMMMTFTTEGTTCRDRKK